MSSDNLESKKLKILKTTITSLKAIWYFPNYLSKLYYALEQTSLNTIYYYTPNIIKNSLTRSTTDSFTFLNKVYLENKDIILYVPNFIYNNSPFIIQNYLNGAAQTIFKSIPKPYEIVTGAIRPSVLKYMMAPLENSIGDNANLFGWIMDFTRIFTFQDYVEKKVEVGNTGMKYNQLHIESVKINFVIKLSSIISGVFYNGLEKGSLTGAITKGNFISEPFSKGFIVLAEKKFKMGKEDLDSYEFIKTYGEKSWLLEILIGGLSRVYISNKIGETIEKFGIHKSSRDIGNSIETETIKLVSYNTIIFNSSDSIVTKYIKIVESENGIFDQIKWIPAMIPIAFIDVVARYTPYSLGGIPLVTTTRMVCTTFQKLIDNPSELNVFESSIILLTSISATTSILPYTSDFYNYIYPDIEDNRNIEYTTIPFEINGLNESITTPQQDEL